MRLYAGSSRQFITDTVHNQIAVLLKNAFFNAYGFNPSPAEIQAWRNSIRAFCQVIQYAKLLDHGIILEYQLPLSSLRLDCLVTGRNEKNNDNAVIVELKQWEKCNEAEGEREISTWVGGAEREILHPSAQGGQYCLYLQDMHTAFYEGPAPVSLSACSYLHNYSYAKADAILSSKFDDLRKDFPLFSQDDVELLSNYLAIRLSGGKGQEVLTRIEDGKYRPSKKLMEHVAGIIRGKPEYILLDEQLVAYDNVMAFARSELPKGKKAVVLVKGGPGTGKSVIALNLMASLLSEGYNAHYATGSRAFTGTLRKIIGTRGSPQFRFFNSYVQAPNNAVDVLLCDEAHRIRETSNSYYTKSDRRSKQPQISELMDAARICVFFVDEDQVVRPGEIGSFAYIKSEVNKRNYPISEHELQIQFRCSGSEALVKWIENTLGIHRTANALWPANEEFDFRIFPSPLALEDAIRAKADQGFSARMTAGFCWNWSKNPKPDGTLNNDVVIETYNRPWNARPESTRLAKGIPKATLWAHEPGGINQVGCVYTAQGFEFDYVGVIFGNDLAYDLDQQKWEGHPECSGDPVVRRSPNFLSLVKNTYRVLLSRGLKGCYVYFTDKGTERFFKSRMEKPAGR